MVWKGGDSELIVNLVVVEGSDSQCWLMNLMVIK
jgi:hypothetical protein